MVEGDQQQDEQDTPETHCIQFRCMEPGGKAAAAEKDDQDNKQGEQDIGDQGGGLDLILLMDIIGFAEEFDHGVAEQSLFNGFHHGKDTQEKGPDTHFRSGREYLFRQYDIADHAKSDQGKTIQQGEKYRFEPEGGQSFDIQFNGFG